MTARRTRRLGCAVAALSALGLLFLACGLGACLLWPVGKLDFALHGDRYRAHVGAGRGCVQASAGVRRTVVLISDRGHFGRYGYVQVSPASAGPDLGAVADGGCGEWEHATPVASGWWALESHLD